MGSDTIGAKQSGHYKCPLYYEVAGCPLLRGLECIEVYGDIQSGHSELSVISQVFAVQGCLLKI